ncbi:ABC transporter ATP-binding protein [Euhalothece natronophila Z-M001]|uniref:ABC transporter ATP-binding protein n=1 Tax=Euhalothece natronophila Z-M001 TaxID=522448 RepID=A0A5B8NIB7_9CHRO|nr:ABC transporter ATP-binding protein [Euhalothece natronophila]QDZ38953.1 ABC transporter ATP-binding protein [Euhalothece natronophila Z-M001]
MPSTLIQLDNLSKVYGTGNATVHALNQVNLTIEEGEYCSIMGASGSGKSTAMNVIGCLDRPTAGHYYFDQQDVSLLPNPTLADIRNRKIGFVFQQFHLLPHLTALDNVILPMIYAGVSATERKDRAVRALERVGLGSRLYNKPNQLSGGQQQRVAIARAIVNNPRLLLADEPTGALDSRTVREILAIFQELHETGITIVMVTHEVEVAKETKRIVWFRDGNVVYDHLTPEEMLEVAIS